MNAENTLQQILLQPTDVLFFRDGRPMSGSLAGHTAAWPLPDVTNHALHAALHRADLQGTHTHRRGRSGNYSEERDRKFGCLTTAGPFPVRVADPQGHPLDPPRWFFPRPKDAELGGSVAVTLRPLAAMGDHGENPWSKSSLPAPLKYAVANAQPPRKDAGGEPWISGDAYATYLREETDVRLEVATHFLEDTHLADTEQTIGIGINPETQTQDKTNFYSAHYLRLREGWRLGLFAEARDKQNGSARAKRDLIRSLFNDHPQRIVVGGQQRICTASRREAPRPLPLPRGLTDHKSLHKLSQGKYAVKWVLLTPAIWPEIPENKERDITTHPGGWLPNWIHPETGAVLLKAGDTSRHDGEGRERWRQRVRAMPAIAARLVAAIVPKPIVVTGWALGIPGSEDDHPSTATVGGAKSTHLAAPAGAVYYFEADSPEAATQLAAALNWHGGDTNDAEIKNRRSTLLGEKGYGLGVCGTWEFYPGRDRTS